MNSVDFRDEFVPERTQRNGMEPDADAAGGEGWMRLFIGPKEALRHWGRGGSEPRERDQTKAQKIKGIFKFTAKLQPWNEGMQK